MASTDIQSPQFSILILTLVLLLPSPSLSSDPDPLQDFCIADLQGSFSVNGFPCKLASNVTSDDFFFDGLAREGNTNNSFGSNVMQGNVRAFPGLNTLGISMNRVDIAPGGITHPHTHPRSTESGIVIQGQLLVGMITTSGVFYTKNLTAGQMFVIPRGLVHFQMNIGNEKALVYSAFNSHMPGSVIVSLNLFGSRPSLPNDVLTKAFLVNDSIIDQIKSKFG
ncbi:RmlC-like cupins superfamily protein [Perilla frutescens var. hirtella]|uniref:Germin-like protein n=1 Tax=Perilla frutescens var. hirtella TaxID=608512 RepID=A0AAD4JP36_PERFH|nr:RmlC-like cupins superfamily protein [Perilla frutescens var. hirtella]